MTTGAWILVVAVAGALAFGGWRAATDGRFRRTQAGPAAELVAELGENLGEKATLLQFSSAFCAPCRATRRVLADVAGVVPGVAHVEVDAEHHLEAVRRLGVARTPTTLVLDAQGREVSRAAGAPRKEQVLTALAQAQPEA
jgi:thiol-disulfide isomerase/thioredoxin